MIPLVGGSDGFIDPQFDPQLTINLYPEVMPGSDALGLIMVPGANVSYTNVSGNNTRALFADRNDLSLFAVYEDNVIKHDAALSPITLGTLGTTSGVVRIESNNSKQITFVDGINGWVYDYSGTPATFTQITSSGFPSAPIDVSFLDGHMLIAWGGTNEWVISDIDDATSYDPLNFAQITSDEEQIVGIRVVNRRIFVFGKYITEVFYNSENASSFPFVRDNNVVLQYGCASLASIAQDENKLVWVASQKNGPPAVRVTNGGPASRISTAAVEYDLQSFTSLSDCWGFLYKINSQTFYMLNNPVDNKTWVYSFENNLWFNQEMIDRSYYFATTHAVYKNVHYLGHYAAPKLSELSNNYYTTNGENIHTTRIMATIRDQKLRRLRNERFELQGFMGRGAPTFSGTNDFEVDPILYLSVSRDGGVTYDPPEKRSLGKVGEYNFETVFTQLGVAKSFTFKLETFNATRIGFLRADGLFVPIGY